MLTTPELIIALERRGVLPQGDVVRVRNLYENSPNEFVPRVMLKWLAGRNRLTFDEADRLLSIDPNLTAAEALDRVLSRNDHLELASDDDELHDEETKDLLTIDDEDELQLPPKGTAPFADSPDRRKQALIPATPVKYAAPNRDSQPWQMPDYIDPFDELLAGSNSELLPVAKLPAPRPPSWDMQLVLSIGGAVTAVLILVAGLIWWNAQDVGDDAFAAAEGAYRSADYPTAVERYDEFLADFPSHHSAGTAAVHRGLAELREMFADEDDMPRTLQVAKTTLAKLASRPEFAAAKADLASFLPDVALRLARQAVDKNDASSLEQARAASELVERYVAAQDAALKLHEIAELMATAERRASRDAAVRSAVAAIRSASVARDLEKADAARRKLLGEFADAGNEPLLFAALRELSETKRQAVRFVGMSKPAETSEPTTAVERIVTLANRRGETTAATDGVVFAEVEGTLFVLSAADGRVIRRRTIGFDAGPLFFTDAFEGGDLLIDEGPNRGIVRLGGHDGVLQWRQPAAHGELSLDRDRLFAVSSEGASVVDARSGKLLGDISFPRKPAGASTGDPLGRVRYQLGEADDLFVLAAVDHHCLQAYFLGHAAGSIAVGPTCVGRYVLIVENSGDDARLRLFETAIDGTIAREVEKHTLSASRPPQASGQYVAVVTNAGAACIFDFADDKDRRHLDPVAQLPAAGPGNLARQFIFRGSDFWLAGNDLAKYVFHAKLGDLELAFTALPQRTSLQRLQLVGGTVACLGLSTTFAGPRSMSALDARTAAPIWETDLGLRLRGTPLVSDDGKTVTCLTESAAIYDVRDDETTVIDKPTGEFANDLVPRKTFSASTADPSAEREDPMPTRLPDGAAAYVLDHRKPIRSEDVISESIAVLEKPGTMPRTIVTPPLGAHRGVADCISRRASCADASGRGPICRSSHRSAKGRAVSTAAGRGARPAWSQAVVLGNDILIADAHLLYRLGLDKQPSALHQRSAVELRRGASVLSAIGKTVYLAESGPNLRAYSIADLKPGQAWKIAQIGDWGPTVIGDYVLTATPAASGPSAPHQYDLLALSGDGVPVWQVPLERPCYRPIGDRTNVYLADAEGNVIQLEASSGKEKRRVKVDVPIAASPAAAGNHLILPTEAGELIWIAEP